MLLQPTPQIPGSIGIFSCCHVSVRLRGKEGCDKVQVSFGSVCLVAYAEVWPPFGLKVSTIQMQLMKSEGSIEPFLTFLDIFEPFSTFWNFFGPFWTLLDFVGLFGPLWTSLDLFRLFSG